MLLYRKDERDRQASRARPPAIAAAPPAGELVAGQHDRGGEELFLLAQDGGVIVGAPDTREEVQTKRLDLTLQPRELVAVSGHFRSTGFQPVPSGVAFYKYCRKPRVSARVENPCYRGHSRTTSRSRAWIVEPGF